MDSHSSITTSSTNCDPVFLDLANFTTWFIFKQFVNFTSSKKMTSQLPANYQALLNQMILMEQETGKANSPPKMISLDRYLNWKGRFESYCRMMDVRMWMCITNGYTPPTVAGDTPGSSSARLASYEQMDIDKKKDYEAESKALGSL